MQTYSPEKLSLWDRWFNRYKKIPVKQSSEIWHRNIGGIPVSEYERDYVVYHIVDRLTGSYTIRKDYLN